MPASDSVFSWLTQPFSYYGVRMFLSVIRFYIGVVLIFAAALSALGQSNSGVLRGQVTDPSGAAVTNATIVVKGPAGESRTVRSNRQGEYELNSLPTGKYSLKASATGFADFETDYVEVITGQPQRLDI